MSQIFNHLSHRLKAVASACPYTALGKKALHALKAGPPQPAPDPDLSSRLRGRIAMGRNIALIGFFCPIFWCCLLAGAKAQTVWFNAVHSGIVMLIGLALMAQGKLALKRATGLIACQSPKQTEYRFAANRPPQAS